MNNRLTELKQKAYVIKDGEFCFDGGEVEILDVNLFAELIVRECGDVAYRAFWADPDNVRGRHIEEQIKQHFGVEE